jgi:hypothetical protein
LRSILCGSLLIVLACANLIAQADFSADIVNVSASNTFPTRLFVTKNKLRLQGEDRAGHVTSIMMVNLSRLTSVVLIPQQKKYYESSQPQIPGQSIAFFQPKNIEDACADWQKMMQGEKDECRKIGRDPVNGRDTVRYESTSSKGTSSVWIDSTLHFPVKWKSASSTVELRNIKEEAQSPTLFQVPSGYVKRASPSKTPPAPQEDRD